ncbi:MAG: lipid II:glycine glycyltransferase FemX [Promethearchaeota archaeon]
MIKLEIINPVMYPKWDELLLSSNQYSFFHSSYWARTLYESHHYRPLYFTLIDKGSLLVSIPLMEVKSIFTGKRGVSLPFSDYCDPIISRDVQLQDISNHIIKFGKQAGWKFIELRGGEDFLKESSPSIYYYSHILDLSNSEEQMLLTFRSSTKRNIRKAIKEGVEINITHSLESVKTYYHLHCITRKFHGLPPQPYYFFKKIYDYIILNKHGFIALASYRGKTIAGAVYFHLGRKAIFKFGASDRQYHYLRPNNLVMWEAIKWCRENGYQSLCFGKTEPRNKGLLQFKSGWGTEEKLIKYYRYDLIKNEFIISDFYESGFHTKILNKLPIPVLNIIGALFYKHFG